MKIPYAGRVYDQQEKDLLIEAANEFWLTSGRFSAQFEKGLSEYLGVRYCSLCNSGSSANLLAFMTLTSPLLREKRIKRGDEVITTAACFPTTVAPIVQYGAVPVFVDITIPEYNVDCDQLRKALSPKTKAIMLAHTMGNPFDLHRVKKFCDDHGLWLIEDNCDALGSRYFMNGSWKYTGTIGHIGTSSFYPAHHITTGEGGAVYTNDPLLNKIVNSLRDWGRDCFCPSGSDDTCGQRFNNRYLYGTLPPGYDHKYVYSHFGYNLKITDMQSAVGCAQLDKLPRFVNARKANWLFLKRSLSGIQSVILPEISDDTIPSWFGFVITVKEDMDFSRAELIQNLEAKGIQTRMLFAGNILRQPCFEGVADYRVVGELKNTDTVMNNSFMVGVYPGLTPENMEFIADQIMQFTGDYAYTV